MALMIETPSIGCLGYLGLALLFLLLPWRVRPQAASEATVELCYELDMQAARRAGLVTQAATSREQLLQHCLHVIEARVQPLAIRPDGEARLVLQLGPQHSPERVRAQLARRGELAFRIRAEEADFARAGTSEAAERARVLGALQSGAAADLAAVNAMLAAGDARTATLRWYRQESPDPSVDAGLVPSFLAASPEQRFETQDFQGFERGQDATGAPCIRFELRPDRREAFGDFSQAHLQRYLAVVLDEEVLVLPSIHSRLPGAGEISAGPGGFDPQQLDSWLQLLHSGPLPLVPTLVSERALR